MKNEELELYVKKACANVFKKLAENPKEMLNLIELQDKHNNLLKEKIELKRQLKEKSEVIDKAKSLNHEISHTIYEDFLEKNIMGSKFLYERIKKQLSILEDKEVSE